MNLDASRIMKGLYQGGRPPIGDAVRKAGFNMLVLCAQEYQPDSSLFPGISVVHAPFDDNGAPLPYELKIADKASEGVAMTVRAGMRVLVTCQAGRNRSGLVTALAIHRLTGASGYDVVKLVKARREDALTNEYFVRVLCQVRAHHGE